MALLGTRFFLSAARYAQLARQAADEMENLRPLTGPRILIKGYPLDHDGLHRQVEAHGGVVFAEDDPWGSRGVTPNIASSDDPLAALVEHYHSQVSSPRVFPLHVADQWFHDKVRLADGVICYLPPDDDLHGWDYPRHAAFLNDLKTPHLLVRIDAAEFLLDESQRPPATIAIDRELGAFIQRLKSSQG
jgi:hypothetical protein